MVAIVLVPLFLGAQRTGTAGHGQAPADVRALLGGTWELEEWHHDGQVLRPPQVGGRWSNHDGTPNDRREYDGGAFLYMPNGQLLRKYRKVQ